MSEEPKKRMPRLKGGHRVRDAAGRPLIGMVHGLWTEMFPSRTLYTDDIRVWLRVEENVPNVNTWIARPVALLFPETRKTWTDKRTGKTQTKRTRPECIQFAGIRQPSDARHVYAPFCPGHARAVLLVDAIKKHSETQWWVNAEGTLERRPTLYEERLPDLPPRPGWKLISNEAAFALVGHEKIVARAHGESDTEREEREARAAEKQRRHLAKIDNAKAMIERYARRQKLAQTLHKKWTKRLARLEKKGTTT